MGYDAAQIAALAETIARSDAEVVVAGTPADIGGLAGVGKPVVRARYAYEDVAGEGLGATLDAFLATAQP